MQAALRPARAAAVQRPAARRITRTRAARAPVRIVAYRDRDAHREQQISDMGREVVNAWFNGLKSGATKEVKTSLEAFISGGVKYSRPQITAKAVHAEGLAALADQIEAERQRIDLQGHRIIADAACPLDDTFFALVEFKYRSKQAQDAKPVTAYKVLEFDVLYDDGARMVTGIHERTQLLPEDVTSIASIDSAQALLNGSPFPEDRLGPFPEGVSIQSIQEKQKQWCRARCSGESEGLLDDVMDKNFRLWDAYGVLPILCDPSRRAQADACVIPYEHVKDIVGRMKQSYDIDCQLLDEAVSSKCNAAFTHWRSRLTNRETQESFAIEGVEVELVSRDGKFTDIWLFRDPMDRERKALQGGNQQ